MPSTQPSAQLSQSQPKQPRTLVDLFSNRLSHATIVSAISCNMQDKHKVITKFDGLRKYISRLMSGYDHHLRCEFYADAYFVFVEGIKDFKSSHDVKFYTFMKQRLIYGLFHNKKKYAGDRRQIDKVTGKTIYVPAEVPFEPEIDDNTLDQLKFESEDFWDDRQELLDAIKMAIKRCKPQIQEVLIKIYYQEIKNKDIAQTMKISPVQVTRYKQEGLEKISSILREEGFFDGI